ncbi:Diacylglycerol kinase, catalytic region domain protein, partial [mine drainage metagenome]
MTRKIHAILNPNAGGGYASNIWPHVKSTFSDYDFTYSITQKHGDAELFAEEAIIRGAEFIAVVGGDGTLNEVVQSCARENIVVIPVSAGTGSDFIRNFSINREESIRDMIDGDTFVNI